MNIRKQFQYDPDIEVSASQIGISKWNWISIKSTDHDNAVALMKEHRFDVMPIENEDGTITSFYSTQEWNVYDFLNKNKIKDASTIYYRLSLKDLVRKFRLDGRHFYFLTDYDQIIGLVSYVNLNCQLVYNYLFFIITDIERSVSDLLRFHVKQTDVISLLKESTNSHYIDIYKSFQSSIDSNNDSDIFQHMYLPTVGMILSKFYMELPNDCKKLNIYSSKFAPEGIYNKVRNKIMHPVRPILSDNESIKQIDTLLSDYDDIKNIIEKHNAQQNI